MSDPVSSKSTGGRSLSSWMRRLRVWEANRKVFEYPENYLDPDPPDDKTAHQKEDEAPIR